MEAQARRLAASPTDIKLSLGPESETIANIPVIELVAYLNKIVGRQAQQDDGTYIDYVPATWLAPAGELVDKGIEQMGKQMFIWLSAPRNHGKSDLILAAIIKHLARWPQARVGYLAHTEDFVKAQAGQVKRFVEKLGWQRRSSSDRLLEFEFPTNGGFQAKPISSVGQGRRFKLLIIDDPFKSALEAKSKTERDKIIGFMENDLYQMIDPSSTIILVHSRFDIDDPIGHYKKKAGWVGVNIKALTNDEEGNPVALWPLRFPVEKLLEIEKRNPTVFATQYQGEPRSQEGTLFSSEPTYYDIDKEFPKEYMAGSGLDLAFSGKASSRGDWSVRVRMLRVKGEIPKDNYGRVLIDPETGKPFSTDKYYIVEVIREQKTSVDFATLLRRNPDPNNAPLLWRMSGVEKGTADFIRREIPRLIPLITNTRIDKYQWATPLAVAWNSGRVLLPKKSPDSTNPMDISWVEDFVSEIMAFQGLDRETDDQVDAAANAFMCLQKTHVKPTIAYVPLERTR